MDEDDPQKKDDDEPQEKESEGEEEGDKEDETDEEVHRIIRTDQTDDYLSEIAEFNERRSTQKEAPTRKRKLRFFEAKDTDKDALIIAQNASKNDMENKRRKMEGSSFENRVKIQNREEAKDGQVKVEVSPFGPRSLTFTPKPEFEPKRFTREEKKTRNQSRRSLKNIPKRPTRQR